MQNSGAGNGTRTRDFKLGKLALYQLSYSRSLSGEKSIQFLKQCQVSCYLRNLNPSHLHRLGYIETHQKGWSIKTPPGDRWHAPPAGKTIRF
jgi:hypothetical protein